MGWDESSLDGLVISAGVGIQEWVWRGPQRLAPGKVPLDRTDEVWVRLLLCEPVHPAPADSERASDLDGLPTP